MRVVVTGAAGFIGSHLAEALLRRGDEVIGVDCYLEESYAADVKRDNVKSLLEHDRFSLVEADLRLEPLEEVLAGADAVVNEAAMPGLVKSWSDLQLYVTCNLMALDRLLQAATRTGVSRFLQVSTSSVYGRSAIGAEDQPTEPYSPYGVSKLAAEKLLFAHVANFGFPAIVLRYFSIYGPRQRPDMGYHLFAEAMLDGRDVPIFGDGRQSRSNTYVDDCVAGTIAALDRGRTGEVYNISGGQRIELLTAVEILADALGVRPRLVFQQPRPGDQRDTHGDSSKAAAHFGYAPSVEPDEGLRRQATWHLARRGTA